MWADNAVRGPEFSLDPLLLFDNIFEADVSRRRLFNRRLCFSGQQVVDAGTVFNLLKHVADHNLNLAFSQFFVQRSLHVLRIMGNWFCHAFEFQNRVLVQSDLNDP